MCSLCELLLSSGLADTAAEGEEALTDAPASVLCSCISDPAHADAAAEVEEALAAFALAALTTTPAS